MVLATGLIALVAVTVPLFGEGAEAVQALGAPVIVTGAGAGGGPNVRVFSNNGGTMLANFFAYGPTFTGGVHVATGDFDGNGRRSIVTGPGPGGAPTIRIFNIDGSDTGIIFDAYGGGFPGGVWVAAGDVNQDGRDELITGAGPGGGPHVKVWALDVGKRLVVELSSFFAYGPSFPGGVRVATSDLFGATQAQPDGRYEILTGAGPGGGPDVQIWDMFANEIEAQGGDFVYGPTFTGGVFVGGDAPQGADLITGAGAGGGPHVKAISTDDQDPPGFFAYGGGFPGGVSVAGGDVAGDGSARVITGAGPGGGPNVRVFTPDGSAMTANFMAYDIGFPGGVYVAFGRQNPPPPGTTTTTISCVTTSTAGASTTSTTGGTTTTTSGGLPTTLPTLVPPSTTTTTDPCATTTTTAATTTTTSGATTTTSGATTTTAGGTTTTTAAGTTTTTSCTGIPPVCLP